jgi:uncharacterized protein (TIGR01777 family)
MLLPFRLGTGGRLGSGRQWTSWVSLDDVTGAIRRALADDELAGVANVVAPNPVTNAGFTRTLAHVLHRPAIVPVPTAAMRLVLGEFARDLLASARVAPKRLAESGYEFRHPELEPALRELLGR